ncbi:MAG: 5-formyltetrahydrofolate cyclo-ligase [Clostridium sp.]|nr:5-formyltetrahydrofolate cyclo-ligase [Clostridium sp.]
MEKSMSGKQTMAEEKRRVRKNILALRDILPYADRMQKSERIIRSLVKTELYKKADVILTYANYQSEVITALLIEQAITGKKRVYAPKVTGNEMDFYRISGLKSLTAGYKGILEPQTTEPFDENTKYAQNALMIMPGAVFDESRHRIGYGKGFYDRYLSRMERLGIFMDTVALCYECQVLPHIPHEIHDKKASYIITEKRVIKAKENL